MDDPNALSNYEAFRRELGKAFVQPDPASLAYDGITWIVRAGIVDTTRIPDLQGAHLTLRRGLFIPDLYQARLTVPGLHDSRYEYSELGGFYMENTTLGNPVAPGHYPVMQHLISRTDYDAGMTHLSAVAIVEGWRGSHPDEPLPDEVLGILHSP